MIRASLFVTIVFTAFSAQAAPCDRACLKSTLDAYLTALVKHDASTAPLTLGFRQTENAQVRNRGAGLWQSVTGLGSAQRRYFDPVTEQAAYFGLLNEAAGPAIAALRLKIEDRKITEAEWIINRKDDPTIQPPTPGQASKPFYDPEYFAAHAPPERVVPKSQRLSRADLVAITNTYFDSLTAHDGKIMMSHPGCVRVENGNLTTQRPNPNGGLTDCAYEGGMAAILAVTARRYPIVDDEAGAVLGMALFQRKPGALLRRNLLAEWFYIDQRKIREVYAAIYYPEPDALIPNWPPFDGNWPPSPPPK